MDPITREETLLNGVGGDLPLEPLTRREANIASLYDASYAPEEEITREDYFFRKAREAGGGGSSVTVEELDVTENGTYTAPSGTAYSPVVANVPNSYAAADEGKVVSSGALVAQTARTIQASGSYDTTRNNSVIVGVTGDVAISGTLSCSDSGNGNINMEVA